MAIYEHLPQTLPLAELETSPLEKTGEKVKESEVKKSGSNRRPNTKNYETWDQ